MIVRAAAGILPAPLHFSAVILAGDALNDFRRGTSLRDFEIFHGQDVVGECSHRLITVMHSLGRQVSEQRCEKPGLTRRATQTRRLYPGSCHAPSTSIVFGRLPLVPKR